MTGSHASGPTGRTGTGRSRPLGWRIGTPVVIALSGALFVVSAADSGGTDLRPGRYTDLASLVEGETDQYEEVEAELRDLTEEVEGLTDEVSTYGVRRARGRVAELSDPAGLEPRSGPGVSITLSDSPQEIVDDAIEAGIEERQLVVHQQDIQAVVNALWRGGATAVTIEDQRLISTTGIKCEGNAVQLHGVPHPSPYDIEAVGDPDALLAALDSDPLVTGYRTDAANPLIQIGWDLEVEDHVEAPAYDGLVAVEHAAPVRESFD